MAERLKAYIKPEVIGWVLVALGVVMRLRQYFYNRSLWGDESSLAVNIVERSFMGLTEPLGYHQAAPLGFLFIEKLLIVVFWNADYILRLFPLLAGLCALYLMYRITTENFGLAGMFALFMFSVNSMLIFYSSELKQYSSDVTVALLLIYLALQCFKANAPNKSFLSLGIAGAITIWISHTSIFILAAIGLTLAIETFLYRRRNFPRIFALGAVWLTSFGLEYFAILQYTADDAYFQTFWARRFVPLPLWDAGSARWFAHTQYLFFFTIIANNSDLIVYIISCLLLIGIASLFIKDRNLALILILIFIVTLAASALKKYPLTYRFMLFLTPLALLLMAEGVERIYLLIVRWQRTLSFVVAVLPAAVLIWFSMFNAISMFKRPQTKSEIKPVVQYVSEHKQPEDMVYVYYGAVPGLIYYAPFYNFGDVNSKNVMLGAYRQNEIKGFKRFFEDMEALKGNERVWFIFSEITECDSCTGDRRLYFENYLNGVGVMLDSVKSTASAAYLYDLKP